MGGGGGVELKNAKAEGLQASDELQEKPRPFLGEDFKVGVAIDHRHFDVGLGQPVVVALAAAAVTVFCGHRRINSVVIRARGVLREGKELCQPRRRLIVNSILVAVAVAVVVVVVSFCPFVVALH